VAERQPYAGTTRTHVQQCGAGQPCEELRIASDRPLNSFCGWDQFCDLSGRCVHFSEAPLYHKGCSSSAECGSALLCVAHRCVACDMHSMQLVVQEYGELRQLRCAPLSGEGYINAQPTQTASTWLVYVDSNQGVTYLLVFSLLVGVVVVSALTLWQRR
jgi:hypothetical protein